MSTMLDFVGGEEDDEYLELHGLSYKLVHYPEGWRVYRIWNGIFLEGLWGKEEARQVAAMDAEGNASVSGEEKQWMPPAWVWLFGAPAAAFLLFVVIKKPIH